MFSNRNFLLVALINLLTMTTYYMLFVVSSPYAMSRFDASPSTGGLVAGLMLIGCLAGRFVTGGSIAPANFKKMLFTGLLIYGGALALHPAVASLPLLMAVRLISGIGVGCIGTVTGTMIVHIVPSHQHGTGISYFSLSTILALAFGPFLGIFLMHHVNFTVLFLISLGIVFAALSLAFFVSFAQEESEEQPHAKPGGFHLRGYISYAALPLAMVTALVCACYGSTQAFLSPFADARGLTKAAGTFFLFYAVAAFCSRPFVGKIFDSKGANVIIYPSILLMAGGLFLLSRADSSAMMLLSGVLLGVGTGNYQTTAQAVSVRLVGKHRFGQATSTHFIFLDLGIGLGPYLLGFIVPVLGYGGLYMVAAGISLACIPLYFLLHGRKAVPPAINGRQTQ